MRGLLKLFMRGIIPKRTKNTKILKRRLFTHSSQRKLSQEYTLRFFARYAGLCALACSDEDAARNSHRADAAFGAERASLFSF